MSYRHSPNRQPVNPAAVESLAASNDYRLGIFTALTDAGRMDLFPAAWRTQKALGEAEVYSVATDDDDDEEVEEKPVISFVRETVTGTGSARQSLARGTLPHISIPMNPTAKQRRPPRWISC